MYSRAIIAVSMKKVFFVVMILLLLNLIGWFTYSYFFKRKEIHGLAKSICDVYLYNIQNPSVHTSFAPDHYILEWQKFEKAYGPTGSKNIIEFCRAQQQPSYTHE